MDLYIGFEYIWLVFRFVGISNNDEFGSYTTYGFRLSIKHIAIHQSGLPSLYTKFEGTLIAILDFHFPQYDP